MKNFIDFLNEFESQDNVEFYLMTIDGCKVVLDDFEGKPGDFENSFFSGYYIDRNGKKCAMTWIDEHANHYSNNKNLKFQYDAWSKSIQRYMNSVKAEADKGNEQRATSKHYYEFMLDCFIGKEKLSDDVLKDIRYTNTASDFGIGESVGFEPKPTHICKLDLSPKIRKHRNNNLSINTNYFNRLARIRNISMNNSTDYQFSIDMYNADDESYNTIKMSSDDFEKHFRELTRSDLTSRKFGI